MNSAHRSNGRRTSRKEPERLAGRADRLGLNAVKKDIASVGQDLNKLKNDTIGLATSAVSSVAKNARHGAENALDTGVKAATRAKDDVCAWVGRRPVASMLIALGVGAVAARILLPRSRR